MGLHLSFVNCLQNVFGISLNLFFGKYRRIFDNHLGLHIVCVNFLCHLFCQLFVFYVHLLFVLEFSHQLCGLFLRTCLLNELLWRDGVCHFGWKKRYFGLSSQKFFGNLPRRMDCCKIGKIYVFKEVYGWWCFRHKGKKDILLWKIGFLFTGIIGEVWFAW